jgi:hypothetical protein
LKTQIDFAGVLSVYDEEEKVAEYRLRPASEGWVSGGRRGLLSQFGFETFPM